MNDIQEFIVKKYISPLDSINRSTADKTLGSVLDHVQSSHGAVFIFDENVEFVGLVSPYKALYSSNYPYTTKVASMAFTPPFITEETPIYEVAEYMVSEKVYVLPVFSSNGEMESVVYGKDILQGIIRDPELLAFISSQVKMHTPITVPITSTVGDVFNNLKEKGVSRMVVVDAEGDLAGIVTRSDLMRSVIKPTSKMRFPKEGTHAGLYSFAGEKKFRKEGPLRKYLTKLVNSLSDSTPVEIIVKHLITSPQNSVVLINKNNKPTGFLSTRDILQAVAQLRPEVEVPLILKKPDNSVSDEELEQATDYLIRFGKKLKKRMAIEKIEVASKGPKNGQGDRTMHHITLIVTPVAGQSLVAITKQRNFLDGIQQATTLIEKQRNRSGESKKESRHASL